MASTPVSRLATLASFPWCRSQDRTVISPFGFPFRGTGAPRGKLQSITYNFNA